MLVDTPTSESRNSAYLVTWELRNIADEREPNDGLWIGTLHIILYVRGRACVPQAGCVATGIWIGAAVVCSRMSFGVSL